MFKLLSDWVCENIDPRIYKIEDLLNEMCNEDDFDERFEIEQKIIEELDAIINLMC